MGCPSGHQHKTPMFKIAPGDFFEQESSSNSRRAIHKKTRFRGLIYCTYVISAEAEIQWFFQERLQPTSLWAALRAPFGREKSLQAIFSNRNPHQTPGAPYIKKPAFAG
jgi:hypothetical protein